MLEVIKAVFLAVIGLWKAIPDSVKNNTVDAAFALFEQMVRAYYRSKSASGAKPE